MHLLALISGGKDGHYAIECALRDGHILRCTATLVACESNTENDSHTFQAECTANVASLQTPALRVAHYSEPLHGKSISVKMDYIPTEGDEIEQLVTLVKRIQKHEPTIKGIVTGVIASHYQRSRIEHVCQRTGMVAIAPLWQREQERLIRDMVEGGLDALVVRTASMGLTPRHCGQHLAQIVEHLTTLSKKYAINAAGEGGEYETFVLDGPLFAKRIVVDEQQVVVERCASLDSDAVAVLKIQRATLIEKEKIAAILNDGALSLPAELLTIRPKTLTNPTFPDSGVSLDYFDLPALPMSYSNVAGFTFVSNLHAIHNADDVQQAASVMENLRVLLHHCALTVDDVIFTQYVLNDMRLFTACNETYARVLPLKNPASRACISLRQLPLQATTIECIASKRFRQTLHVQSISNWAPACIGPYSQASIVCGVMFLAGQIGLHSSCMELLADAAQQLRSCWQHCEAVLKSLQSGLANMLTCIVYFTEAGLLSIPVGSMQAVTAQYLPAKLVQHVQYIQVVALPRAAMYEVHITAVQSFLSSSLLQRTHIELLSSTLCTPVYVLKVY